VGFEGIGLSVCRSFLGLQNTYPSVDPSSPVVKENSITMMDRALTWIVPATVFEMEMLLPREGEADGIFRELWTY
jgi:hypothetical protein